MSVHAAPVTSSTVVVAVDVGKRSVALSVTDAGRHRVLGPVEFEMTRSALASVVGQVRGVLPDDGAWVKVGVEACGHYHQPLLAPSAWPSGWEVLELNPGHVCEQRRVMGRRRVKTDAFDLEAITELLLAGAGVPVTTRELVLGELRAWTAHRTRRVAVRTATKNQLLGQVTAAREALPTADAAVARRVVATDLRLLNELERQICTAEQELAMLLPASPFRTLTSVPGWGVVRAANYAGALGDPRRWPGPAQIYRASGLSPAQYESAGRRRDGAISREGSVVLRRALIDLGVGLWLNDPAAKQYAAGLKARGKRGGVIACALAHRATHIAHALVRDQARYDQARYDPGRWT
ncbi:transposase [Kribbella sp. VKM Ac-2571]|uniref:IS110 family transposase n=1 Tax=Kribbella sp. VKM Ac-2571 TaxID=2512222 RepID=UPI00105FE570|nr:transposase [Kribbella sp. VKM Ac-2571]TDO46553.1 transposase [Kribbella sp. VKM Ac-2571]